jgi:hypothetical protein
MFCLMRVMVLWVVLYFVDKSYQARYVQRTLVEGGDPPRLWTMVLTALAIEAIVMLLVGCVLLLVSRIYKTDANSFVIDGKLLGRLAVSYAVSTLAIAVIGFAYGSVMQDPSRLRYKQDGLRAIRSLSVIILLSSAVIIATPLIP